MKPWGCPQDLEETVDLDRTDIEKKVLVLRSERAGFRFIILVFFDADLRKKCSMLKSSSFSNDKFKTVNICQCQFFSLLLEQIRSNEVFQ